MSAKDNCIRSINKETVHKICSGQVVLSLAVAIKELVENSLDADATNIDIRLKNYGLELIEVADNGSGVTEDNFAALTLKYHTSKLNEYSDLLGVSSFGFRGEALSSLCALANLTITTRHQSSQYATKIEYDHKGNIVKKTPCSRQIGTTVTLSNLFHSLPVRQKELQKNSKREFNKMTQLLYSYCLISKGVKINCSNQTSSNSKSVVVATQGSHLYKDNIACIFGVKQLQSLLEIKIDKTTNIKENIFKGLSGQIEEPNENITVEDIQIDLSEESNDSEEITCSQKSQGHKNIINPVDISGYISSCAHGSGRSSSDRQFYYINCRPCEPTKIIKLVNEIYRQYNPNQYPFVFLNINIDRHTVDVNVTPDKRKVFLTKEKVIIDALKSSLQKLFESIPRSLKVEPKIFNNCENKSNELKPNLDQPRVFNSFMQQFAKKPVADNPCKNFQLNKESNTDLKRKSSTMLDYVSQKCMRTEHEDKVLRLNSCNEKDDDIDENNKTVNETEYIDLKHEAACTEEPANSMQDNDIKKMQEENNIMYLEHTDSIPETQIRSIDEVIVKKSHTVNIEKKTIVSKSLCSSVDKISKKVVTDKEDLGKHNRKSVSMKTSLENVKALAQIYITQKAKLVPNKIKFKSEINPVFNKKCEEELIKEISKESFKNMSVIGQFNLGFIITQLDDDLFIIDQHATDEIYNFETLQKTTELTNQKLVIPQQLELSGVNEQILMDNIEVFKKNGFTFEINENAAPTKRVKLLTIPMSKNWIFGKEDIEELLFMLRESQSEYCRPSRVRAMFASRACRKSVMIGTALSKSDMKMLVDHMVEIDKPWNCPHGRPTIRHLVNMAMVVTRK